MVHVVLSKPIKPMYVIVKGKSILYQHNNDVIAGGPIVNIYNVYKTTSKIINSSFVFRNCLFGTVKITNATSSYTDIWVVVLHLIEKKNLHIRMVEMVKMLLFLELI